MVNAYLDSQGKLRWISERKRNGMFQNQYLPSIKLTLRASMIERLSMIGSTAEFQI